MYIHPSFHRPFIDNWFHPTCLGITEEDSSKFEEYFCKNCRDWGWTKKQFFESYFKNAPLQDFLPESKYVDKNGIIPKDSARFTMLDYLIMTIMLQLKMTHRLKTVTNFKNYLYELMDTAKFLPFNINGLICSLVKKFYFSQILDKILTITKAHIAIGPIESIFDPIESKFDQEKITNIKLK